MSAQEGQSGHAADVIGGPLLTLAVWKLIHRRNVENTILQPGGRAVCAQYDLALM